MKEDNEKYRQQYVMTEFQLTILMNAERLKQLEAAWEKLGEDMGFDYKSVCPVKGKGRRTFTAIPLHPVN